MPILRRFAVPAAKAAVAAALVVWLVRSGLLSPATLAPALERPVWLAAGTAALLGVAIFAGLRWHCLLMAQGMRPDPAVSVRLSFVGLFFSLVVPGGISGDVLRVFYSARLPGGHRAGALASVAVDRVLHLSVFLVFAAFAVAFYPGVSFADANIRVTAGLLALYFALIGAAAALVASESVRRHAWVEGLLGRLPFHRAVTRLYDAARAYRTHPAQLAAAAGAGALAVAGSMAAYYCYGRALGDTSLGAGAYVFAVPLVAVASAIPLTPGGVGLGQAAALVAFAWAGADPALGVNVVTLVQAGSVFVSLPGAVLYLTHRDEARQAAAEPS